MKKKNNFDEKSLYGNFEMAMMLKSQEVKHKILKPLLIILTKLHVNAHIISAISAITASVTFYYSVQYQNPLYFVIGIWLHMFLDSLDGALARYQNKASQKGTIIDVIGDQFGITLMCVFVYLFNYVNVINISIFFILYLVVIIFSLYLMAQRSRYEIVMRPRIFFYIAVTWDFLIFIHLTEVVVFISNILLLFAVFFGIYQIRKLK